MFRQALLQEIIAFEFKSADCAKDGNIQFLQNRGFYEFMVFWWRAVFILRKRFLIHLRSRFRLLRSGFRLLRSGFWLLRSRPYLHSL